MRKWGVFFNYFPGDQYLVQKLKTNLKEGISNDSIDARTHAYGSNRKAVKILKSAMQLFIEACDDFTLKILIVAAIVSIGKSFFIQWSK